MKEALLQYLCCPGCSGGLVLKDAVRDGGEIRSAVLLCAACGTPYPVVNAIPRFVASDAYAGNFSFEWTVHKTTQLDSATGTGESLATFVEKTGERPEGLAGKVVLDVGCGTGRFMEVLGSEPAAVVGIDLSLAVESARDNLQSRPNMHVIQASVFNLPLRPGSFDFIYSIGVLHHTPSTRDAFRKLPPLLRPGGAVAVWVYSDETRYLHLRNRFSDVYRLVTVHLPARLLWLLSHLAIPFYHLKKIPKLGTLLDVVLPMSNHPDRQWRVLDTYDWYSPKYQFKHTYPEVEQWFRDAGLGGIERLPFPVSVRGKKT